jgi:hypothetical protein
MNYWILQASPKLFLIDYFLDDDVKQHPELLDWWRVHKVHKCDIKDGDIAYIWKAKTEGILPDDYRQWRDRTGAPKKIAGVYAVAGVKGCVRTGPELSAP